MQRITGRRTSSVHIGVEELEPRTLLSILTPVQVRHAYGVDQINFTVNRQTVHGDGSGQTIAIVNAFDHPTIASDVDTFDKSFNLGSWPTLYQLYGPSSKFLTKATPQGQPGTDPNGNWELETALDVEWAHAIAPGAHILLVEAKSDSFRDLMGAVDYARNQPGVVVVSMSWGADEWSGETGWDKYFTTPTGHLGGSNGRGGARLAGGVTFVAASGDDGAPGIWPAVSTNVLAVGGTSLRVDSRGNYQSEVAWNGSGGGYSAYEGEPGFQYGVQRSGRRSGPDVAYNGDPDNGFYVYITYPVGGETGWFMVGGTSAGSPQWAALIAIADQGRALTGKSSLDGGSQTLPAIYAMGGGDFHDVASGFNGYAAARGYDVATGRGSPYADRVVRDLMAVANQSAANRSTTPTSSTTSAHPKAHAQTLARSVMAPQEAGNPPVQSTTVGPAISLQLLQANQGYITASTSADTRERERCGGDLNLPGPTAVLRGAKHGVKPSLNRPFVATAWWAEALDVAETSFAAQQSETGIGETGGDPRRENQAGESLDLEANRRAVDACFMLERWDDTNMAPLIEPTDNDPTPALLALALVLGGAYNTAESKRTTEEPWHGRTAD